MVSLGTAAAPDERLELVAELLDVADVGPDGAVVEGADRRAGRVLGAGQDVVESVFPPLPPNDGGATLVDPPGRRAAGGALPARPVGEEAAPHHERLGDRPRPAKHDAPRRADHRPDVLEP